jgi:hypothetical protein
MKTVLAAILLLECQCLMYEHFHDKALDIKDDSYEPSLPNSFDSHVDNQKLTGAFVGMVEYKNDTYFDVLVDSLLRNRYFSYLHILIPVGKNNEPRMIDSNDCGIYDLYEGKCGDNGVVLLEDSINYKKCIDTITIHAFEFKETPDEDSIEPFTWNGIPRNIYFQFRGYNYDAISFKYINNESKTVFYKSFIKDREIKWVHRKRSKYMWNKTLSYVSIPVDILLSPFEIMLMMWIASSLNFGGG